MRIALLLLATVCVAGEIRAASANDVAGLQLVPQPQSIKPTGAAIELRRIKCVCVPAGNEELQRVARQLATRWDTVARQALRVVEDKEQMTSPAVILRINDRASDANAEAYRLEIDSDGITIAAADPCGVFRGTQTLLQVLHSCAASGQLPGVQIEDAPRYRWRGMLLDCGRHFMTKEFIKRYIDLLAFHKLNVLHWHLTEDQGWRIEIRKHPKLTEIGAWRGTGDERYGGFYTQDDVREIVAYAADRYITVVPEIEMPGHSQAALAAYPELSCTGGPFEVSTRWGVHKEVYCAGNEQTFALLEDVLSEVVELFPSEFIHIGGDECPKDRWKACPKCQARIAAEGLEDEHELQSYFIRRIEKFLASKGKRLVGWDEILEGGLPPNATVQSWRGMKGAIAAATTGHDVVSSPTSHCYLDYAQERLPSEPTWMGFIDLQTCYAFEPTPAELTPEQARHVLGLEGNMWTEHAPQQRIDWQVFPRLCALAEVGWSAKASRDWDSFCNRMTQHYRRLDQLGVTYYIPAPTCTAVENTDGDKLDKLKVTLHNPFDHGEIHYTLDGSTPTAESPLYREPLVLTEAEKLSACTCLESGRSSAVAAFEFEELAKKTKEQ